MKKGKLPKGVVITGALLSAALLATGCSTAQEVIDDYNPAAQIEMDVYGPAPYIPDSDDEVGSTEQYDDYIGEVTLDYGVAEKYNYGDVEGYHDDIIDNDNDIDNGEFNTEDNKDICVYGPEEEMSSENDFDEVKNDLEVICVYGPAEDMINND